MYTNVRNSAGTNEKVTN